MNVSFGSLIVKFNPNIKSNQRVFNDIRKSFPEGTDVISLKDGANGEKSYQITGKNTEKEIKIAQALYEGQLNVVLRPDDSVYKAVEQRINEAIKSLKKK